LLAVAEVVLCCAPAEAANTAAMASGALSVRHRFIRCDPVFELSIDSSVVLPSLPAGNAREGRGVGRSPVRFGSAPRTTCLVEVRVQGAQCACPLVSLTGSNAPLRRKRPSFRMGLVMTLTIIRMMRPLFFSIVIAAAAFPLAACEDDVQVESNLARARDSSLASDLRLANGESVSTLGSDTAAAHVKASVPPMVESRGALPPNAGSARVVSNTPGSTITESTGSLANVSAEAYIGPSCASPALADQQRCLRSYLMVSDVALDRNYQMLISALKREAGTSPSTREPPTVVRLRNAQRNWLVYRDDECRRRLAGTEGPLWAPTRAKCLAEYSALRERELVNALNTRTNVKQVAEKQVTEKKSTVKSSTKSTSAKRAKPSKRSRNRRG